jgi:transposase
MKDQETIEKFIQLRAEGKSFDKIVKLIKVSKPTLIGWERKYETRIEDLKAIRYEQILEKYKLTQEDRLTRLAKELKLAWESFEQKGYESLSKREIMLIIMRLEQSLKKEPAMIAMAKKNDDENEPKMTKLKIIKSIIGEEFEKESEKNKAHGEKAIQ